MTKGNQLEIHINTLKCFQGLTPINVPRDNESGSTKKSKAVPTYTRVFLRGHAKQFCSLEIVGLTFKTLLGLEGNG